jgi:hypothetical protein
LLRQNAWMNYRFFSHPNKVFTSTPSLIIPTLFGLWNTIHCFWTQSTEWKELKHKNPERLLLKLIQNGTKRIPQIFKQLDLNPAIYLQQKRENIFRSAQTQIHFISEYHLIKPDISKQYLIGFRYQYCENPLKWAVDGITDRRKSQLFVKGNSYIQMEMSTVKWLCEKEGWQNIELDIINY